MTTTIAADKGSSRLFIFAIIGLLVAGALGIAFVANSRERLPDADPTAPVEVDGQSLLPMPQGITITDPSNDPNAGDVAPTLTGTTFTGEEVEIGPDGNPKAIYFLAHWCPHCAVEVPLVQQLIDDGAVPDGIDLYAISTSYDATRGNPPHQWLHDEGFEPVTIRDDEGSSALVAFAGTGFPYVVYLDGDNRVISRSSGSLDAETITNLWENTATLGALSTGAADLADDDIIEESDDAEDSAESEGEADS